MKKIGIKNLQDFVFFLATLVVVLYITLIIVVTILYEFFGHQYYFFVKSIGQSNIQFPFLLIACIGFIYLSVLNWMVMGFSSIWYKNKKSKICAQENIKRISVLIPAHNEEKVIAGIINDLMNQNYPDLEIIVIVHNCTDNTFREMIRLTDGLVHEKIHIIVLNTSESGKALALNRGLLESTGEIIAQFDADNRIKDRDFFLKAVNYFQDENISAIQVTLDVNNTDKNILTFLQEVEYDAFSAISWKGRSVLNLPCFLAGTGMLIRKQALLAVNGWHNSLVEDFDLFTRMVLVRQKIIYVDDLIIYDEKPDTWSLLIKQRSRWIKGHLQVTFSYWNRFGNLIDYLYRLSPLSVFAWWVSTGIYIFYYFTNQISVINIPGYIWLGWTILFLILLIYTTWQKRGWKRIFVVPLYWLFGFHWIWVAIMSLFVRSWSQTKTEHFGNPQDPERRLT